MEERPVVRGRIVQATSSKRKRRRCNTTRASISGYSSGKLCRNTFSARWLTPTKPEVGSCTSLPKTGRSIRRKKRIPSERTAHVFVVHQGGVFEPRTVSIGPVVDGNAVILTGLKPGETIVVSGNFLIDSESGLKSATSGMTH